MWDGSLLLAEFDASNNLVRSYVWGLDSSGTRQGANGVGGLLAVNSVSQGSHFAAYDGGGNVVGLADAGSGAQTAHFNYNPFGGFIGAYGSMADEMPLTRDTKYYDKETGKLYYGFERYYDSDSGAWLSKDPIENFDDLNFYGFNRNDPVNRFDPDGRQSYALTPPQAY